MASWTRGREFRYAALLSLVAAIAQFECGGGVGRAPGLIGAAGGTFDAGGGVTIVIPAGALSQEVQLTAKVTDGQVPTLSGYSVLSSLYQFGPDGTAFSKSVTVTLPLPAGAPADSTIFWSRAGDPSFFDDAHGSVSGASISAQVEHFSGAVIVKKTACTPGGPCQSTNPCHTAAIACPGGSPVCTDNGTQPDGTACGSAMICTSGVCGASGGLSVSGFCQGLADMLGKQGACTKSTPASIQALQSSLAEHCADMVKAINATIATYSPTNAATCLSTLRADTCDQLFIDLGGGDGLAACQGVLAGTRNPGDPCRTSFDCSNGTCGADLACPGTCLAWLAAGQPCNTGQAICGPGLVCDYSGLSPTCKATSSAGGSCPCQFGTYCDGSTSTCAGWKTSGACNAADESRECAPAFGCVDSTCQALVGLGATCVPPLPTYPFDSICGLGSFCDSVTKTCIAWPLIGQSCAAFPVCQTGYCDATTKLCTAEKPDGASCVSPLECQSQNCLVSKCAPSTICHEL
jgi:hypothetical protein